MHLREEEETESEREEEEEEFELAFEIKVAAFILRSLRSCITELSLVSWRI